MTKTKKDILVTNVINVVIFVGIFTFGYWRWQLLQDVLVESNASQTRYGNISAALKVSRKLDHLGERVYTWLPSDSVNYRRLLAQTNDVLNGLDEFYTKAQIDSMQFHLNEKARLLTSIYETVIKRNENDEHLREDRAVTVRDTETYVKHYTGHMFRSSREEVSSKSKNRTVTIPSINELAFIDKELCDINLNLLSDSLADVNLWLDENMNQILDEDDTKAQKHQAEMLEKGSTIGRHTFMGGMAFLFFIFGINYWNSKRRAKVVKSLEIEAEKNKNLYRSRREMMYTVTHELKTPLSPIVGYSSLMKETAHLDEKNSGYLNKIYESAQKMNLLIGSLLEYFAIESAKTDVAKKPFNMKSLVDSLTATYRLEARHKNLEFKAYECRNLALMGDEGKLTQIGSNLLANAIKFTEIGSVSLNITYEGGNLIMKVSDTGIGMSEEEQQIIFEPFKQLGKAKVLGKDGIGLGLSIVSQLVKLMNGNIEVHSNSGEGSTFLVTIPVEEMTEANFEQAEQKASDTDEVRRVLAIDDTESCLDMMRDILHENGVECDTCTKPKDLVELMRKKDYDLLVIDLKMPEMNGIELAKILRESEVGNSKSVKMVVSTSWSDEHDPKELLDKGFDGMLPKPFNAKDMMNVVNQLVPKGRKREIPDLSNASQRMLTSLVKEAREGLAALNEAVKKNDIGTIDDWCHRLAGSWGMVHAAAPLDELHELLKSPQTLKEETLKRVMSKVETMGQVIINKSEARIKQLSNE
ncbi:MAG: response regulator [Prevotella sp.]|nr:response regulator [Prevotella sp.]